MSTPSDPSRPGASPIGARIAFLGFAALFCESGLLYSLHLGTSFRYPAVLALPFAPAALRLALAGHRLPLSPPELLVFALYVGTGLFHALLIPRIRYRIPFEFLLLPAANVLLHALESARGRLDPGRRRVRGEADTPPHR